MKHQSLFHGHLPIVWPHSQKFSCKIIRNCKSETAASNRLLKVFHLKTVSTKEKFVYNSTNWHARTPALRIASSFLQIRSGNFQNGLFRPQSTCSTSYHFKFKQLRALCSTKLHLWHPLNCTLHLLFIKTLPSSITRQPAWHTCWIFLHHMSSRGYRMLRLRKSMIHLKLVGESKTKQGKKSLKR